MRNRLLLAALVLVALAGAAWILVARSGPPDAAPTARENAGGEGPRPATQVHEPTLVGRPQDKDEAPAPTAVTTAWEDAPFRGVVVDEAGKPIAGATVSARDATDVPPATTDGQGRFSFSRHEEDDSEDGLYCWAASADHALPEATIVNRDEEARLVLQPAPPIRVHVVDATTGRAIPNSRAQAFNSHWTPPLEASPSVACNPAGVATIAVPVGDYLAVATARGYSPRATPATIVPREGADVHVALDRGGSLVGLVLGYDGSPFRAANVTVYAWPLRGMTIRTGSDGRFRFDGLPGPSSDGADLPPPVTVSAWPLNSTFPHRCLRVDAPRPGTTTDVTLRLPSWRRLLGIVRRMDGASVAGVHVVARAWGGDPHNHCGIDEVAETTTGPDGTFALERIAPGAYQLEVGVRRGEVAKLSVEVPEIGDTPRVDVVLGERGLPLRVRVLDADGGPVPARITVRATAQDGDPRGSEFTARSDATGRATFDSPPKEPVRVLVAPSDGRPGTDVTLDLSDPPVGEVVVRLGRGLVSGSVRYVDGSPAQVSVSLDRLTRVDSRYEGFTGTGRAATRTDAEGRFHFASVSDGAYRLSVEAPDCALAGDEPQVEAGAAEVRLVVLRAPEAASCRVEASLVDAATDAPISDGADVWLARDRLAKSGESVVWSEPTGASGVWRTYAAPPGNYALVVEAEGWRRRVLEGVHVAATEGPTRIRVPLDRGASLTGHVHTPQGQPVEGAVIHCGEVSADSGTDGSFSLTGLDDGVVTVTVYGHHVLNDVQRSLSLSLKSPTQMDVEVQPGGAILVLPRAGTFPSRSLAWTAVPTGGGEPRSQELTGWILHRVQDASYEYAVSLGSLAPGTFRLEITWDGRPLEPRTVTVAALETVKVEVGPP